MADLALRLHRELGDQWIDLIAYLRSTNSAEDIADRIRRHDYDGAIAGLQDAALRFAAQTTAARTTAANEAADWLQRERDRARSGDRRMTPGLITYDTANASANRAAAENRYDKIREISADQRDMVRSVVGRGLTEGKNPLDQARQIYGSIGLTAYQEDIVNNYRTELETGQHDAALSRRLSDGRSDRTVAAAQRREVAYREQLAAFERGDRTTEPDLPVGLTTAQIDLAVDRYRDGWHQYRAETVARQESLRSTHEGTQALYSQAIETGKVKPDELERIWEHGPITPESRPSHFHPAPQGFNQQVRAIGEPFEIQTPGGPVRLMYPTDASGPPEHTINCTCQVRTRYRPTEP